MGVQAHVDQQQRETNPPRPHTPPSAGQHLPRGIQHVPNRVAVRVRVRVVRVAGKDGGGLGAGEGGEQEDRARGVEEGRERREGVGRGDAKEGDGQGQVAGASGGASGGGLGEGRGGRFAQCAAKTRLCPGAGRRCSRATFRWCPRRSARGWAHVSACVCGADGLQVRRVRGGPGPEAGVVGVRGDTFLLMHATRCLVFGCATTCSAECI